MTTNVTVESLVNPTEDPAKVERAVHNIFPGAPIKRTNVGNDVIKLEVSGSGLEFLRTLRALIMQDRIRSAARRILLVSARTGQIRFSLNKQVAFVGRVSFCAPVGESPLGPISIKIETTESDQVIDFLAAIPGEVFRSRDVQEDR